MINRHAAAPFAIETASKSQEICCLMCRRLRGNVQMASDIAQQQDLK